MKHLYRKLAVAALIIIVALIMTSGSGAESAVVSLVEQRTDILNNYYCGITTFKEASKAIETVESGSLLREDINNMHAFFQTDIEEVDSYEIRKVDITCEEEDLICAVVHMDWLTEGLSGKEKIEAVYSVIMEKTENSFKLVQFF